MFNIEAFKNELTVNVAKLVEAREAYHSAASQLAAFGDTKNQSLSTLPNSLSKLLKVMFKEVEVVLTRQYCHPLPVEVVANHRFYEFSSRFEIVEGEHLTSNDYHDLMALEKKAPHDQVIALEAFVKKLPWAAIKADFDKQCVDAKKEGLANAVSTVHNFFNISSRHRKPTIKKGWLETYNHYDANSWRLGDDVREINSVIKALLPLVSEANVEIGQSLYDLEDALTNNWRDSTPIPMRTRFGKGSAIDITVFKSKIVFKLSEQMVDAIQSATILYGDEKDIGNVMEVVEKAA